MDNESLQMVQNWQNEFYNSRLSGSKIKNPDFVKLANSMGIDAIKCSSLDTLDETIDQIINFNGPLLVHFTVKQTKCLPFVAPGKALDDMILK
jgi:acetolactate synthase-1/2/3 large subunit